MSVVIDLGDEAATNALGTALARALADDVAGQVAVFEGELGAGKSTLIRALLRELGHRGTVPSPTYTLVEPYSVSGKNIYHIDLYRINNVEELEFLGWSEMHDGLRLIEWPERIAGLTDAADLRIQLDYRLPGRTADLSAGTDAGHAILSRVQSR